MASYEKLHDILDHVELEDEDLLTHVEEETESMLEPSDDLFYQEDLENLGTGITVESMQSQSSTKQQSSTLQDAESMVTAIAGDGMPDFNHYESDITPKVKGRTVVLLWGLTVIVFVLICLFVAWIQPMGAIGAFLGMNLVFNLPCLIAAITQTRRYKEYRMVQKWKEEKKKK